MEEVKRGSPGVESRVTIREPSRPMAVFADREPRAAKEIAKGWFGNDCNKRNCWPGNATKRASAFRQEVERIEKKEIALPLL